MLATSGEPDEQVDAAKVLKLLERGKHWVLVVLLLSNVVVNESLPIFLDSILGGGVAAVVSSTTLIVIFGEIIPQAICNRYGLKIGAKCTYFVLALMYIEFPIAYPTAKLLDWLLGDDEGVAYRKAELKTFVNLHLERHLINEDEATIIGAVLDLSQRKVGDIMTPIDRTYTLPMDKVLDQAAVDEILALGHSRIPIRSETRSDVFLGMLIVKKARLAARATADRITDAALAAHLVRPPRGEVRTASLSMQKTMLTDPGVLAGWSRTSHSVFCPRRRPTRHASTRSTTSSKVARTSCLSQTRQAKTAALLASCRLRT